MRRMGWLTVAAMAAVLGVCGASRGQEGPPTGPGPELKKLEFLLGKSTAKGKMFAPGQAPTEWTATDRTEWGPGGHSLRSEGSIDYGGGMKDTAVTFYSYDSVEKAYKLYRFSSMDPMVIEGSGKFEGDRLVTMLKPDPTGEKYRVIFAPKGKNQTLFLLEQKKGDAWEKFIEGVYTRS